jgi:hypothetical protein
MENTQSTPRKYKLGNQQVKINDLVLTQITTSFVVNGRIETKKIEVEEYMKFVTLRPPTDNHRHYQPGTKESRKVAVYISIDQDGNVLYDKEKQIVAHMLYKYVDLNPTVNCTVHSIEEINELDRRNRDFYARTISSRMEAKIPKTIVEMTNYFNLNLIDDLVKQPLHILVALAAADDKDFEYKSKKIIVSDKKLKDVELKKQAAIVDACEELSKQDKYIYHKNRIIIPAYFDIAQNEEAQRIALSDFNKTVSCFEVSFTNQSQVIEFYNSLVESKQVTSYSEQEKQIAELYQLFVVETEKIAARKGKNITADFKMLKLKSLLTNHTELKVNLFPVQSFAVPSFAVPYRDLLRFATAAIQQGKVRVHKPQQIEVVEILPAELAEQPKEVEKEVEVKTTTTYLVAEPSKRRDILDDVTTPMFVHNGSVELDDDDDDEYEEEEYSEYDDDDDDDNIIEYDYDDDNETDPF